MDKKAKAAAKDEWKAITREGNLTLRKNLTIDIKWENETLDHQLIGYLNYKGRAMEMSDIVEFNNRLLTVDDKTGLVYDITKRKGKAIPWLFLNSGPGNTTSGMKVEWLTEKDGLLYAGGHGSEYRNTSTGQVTSMDPMWIKTITKTGEVKSLNWFWPFSKLRNASGYPEPGYLTHEAVQWSSVHRKWFFLPRKASKTAYNETEDETKGCQLLITADENFANIVVKKIDGEPHPKRGYSAFDFIPNSRDTVMVALKSEEVGNRTESYVSVLAINGRVFLEDQNLEGDHKFEGIYFI
ncbi:unnamed protein product [Cylicocyclus nassatus]|uniref:Apyrase n=1 Tax=Cylicocyclus nassatus TaxID=53992 RepID=A0AA36M9C9_CYLNA|nr:unnamed protein product [Cylicocyclus nassatus]